MDAYDRKILHVLLGNGRCSLQVLAEQIGLSRSAAQVRLKSLEARGIIRGYRALVDRAALDRAHVAFAEVKLSSTRESSLAAFDKAVCAIPEVEECHMIAGSFDYLLKIRTRDIVAYRRVLGEDIGALPHVASTSTHVAMQAVKEAS